MYRMSALHALFQTACQVLKVKCGDLALWIIQCHLNQNSKPFLGLPSQKVVKFCGLIYDNTVGKF